MVWTVSYERLTSISVLIYYLITYISDYLIPCFPWFFSEGTTANLKGYTFTRPALSSILSRWPNHCSFPSLKCCFSFNWVLSFSPEIFSSGLTLNINLTILVSFLSSLITSFSLIGHVSLPYSIILSTHPEYNLPFATRGRTLLANKGTEFHSWSCCNTLKCPL